MARYSKVLRGEDPKYVLQQVSSDPHEQQIAKLVERIGVRTG